MFQELFQYTKNVIEARRAPSFETLEDALKYFWRIFKQDAKEILDTYKLSRDVPKRGGDTTFYIELIGKEFPQSDPYKNLANEEKVRWEQLSEVGRINILQKILNVQEAKRTAPDDPQNNPSKYTLEDALNDVWQDIGADAEEASTYSKGDRKKMQAEILLSSLRDSVYFREELDNTERDRWDSLSYKEKMEMCLKEID